MKRVSLLWLLLGFVLASCATIVSNPPGVPAPPSAAPIVNQQFLFERSFVNYARGFQHHGFYIDGRGDVYSYQYGTNHPQLTQNKEQITFSTQDLTAKYSSNRKLIGKIEPMILQKMAAKIKAASSGKQSERVSQGADQGLTRRIGYLYSLETGFYRKVMLRDSGDISHYNLSPAARELADWLDSLKFEP